MCSALAEVKLYVTTAKRSILMMGVVLCWHRFSSTCILDSDGQPTCNNCPIGYSGRRCERYATTTPSIPLFLLLLFFFFLPLSALWTLLSVWVLLGGPGSEVSRGWHYSAKWFHSQERDISMCVVCISL